MAKIRRCLRCGAEFKSDKFTNWCPDRGCLPQTEAQAKRDARSAVHQAVKRGELVKPDKCEDCGGFSRGDVRLWAHHPDYSKPLEVIWLCGSCHPKYHKRWGTGESKKYLAKLAENA